jgi:hypothetical protein
MMLGEKQGVSGVLTIEVRDASGALLAQRRVENLVTQGGKKLLADLLMGKVTAPPSAWGIVVGTGTAKPQPENAALGALVDRAAAAGEVAIVTTTEAVVRVTVKATLPTRPASAPTQALTEAGIVVACGATETLFNRVVFDTVNRGATMVMNLAWEISF